MLRLSESCMLDPLLPSCNDGIAEYVRIYQFDMDGTNNEQKRFAGVFKRSCLMWGCFAIMSHFFIFCVFEREIKAHLILMWGFQNGLSILSLWEQTASITVLTSSWASRCEHAFSSRSLFHLILHRSRSVLSFWLNALVTHLFVPSMWLLVRKRSSENKAAWSWFGNSSTERNTWIVDCVSFWRRAWTWITHHTVV